LGIDGGGTKTVCVLATLDRNVIGRGSGGPTNPNLVSAPEIKETLQKAIQEAIHDHPELRIEAVCAGISGVGASEQKQIEVSKVIWQILSTPPLCQALSKNLIRHSI